MSIVTKSTDSPTAGVSETQKSYWLTALYTRPAKKLRATKVINNKGHMLEGYNAGSEFRFYHGTFTGWTELEQHLNAVANNPKGFVVIGKPTSEQWLDGNYYRRLKYKDRKTNTPATLTEAPTHFLPVDVDGFDVMGICPATDPLECVQAVLDALGEPFSSATCWFCFTSTQRPYMNEYGRSSIRMRLIFLLKVAWHPSEMKLWAQRQRKSMHIDCSIYSATQPIYLAKPIVKDSDGDILPERYGMILGAHDLLALQKPEPTTSATCFRNNGTGIWLPDDMNVLDLIGEDAPGIGCYPGVRMAIWHTVRRAGKILTDDEIKHRVRERVMTVEWKEPSHTDVYVGEVLSDGKLDALIHGARAKLYKDHKLFSGVPVNLKSRMTLSAGESMLVNVIDGMLRR